MPDDSHIRGDNRHNRGASEGPVGPPSLGEVLCVISVSNVFVFLPTSDNS